MTHRDGQFVPAQVLARIVERAEAVVKELLVISQDTSAYGVDVKYRTARGTVRAYKGWRCGIAYVYNL